jgi:tetratricopeptide (TPR) repeat protein
MRSPLTAAVTCLSFALALVWPYAAEAADAPPPPPPGEAAPPPQMTDEALQQAKTHFEAGKNAYNAGDYVTAIREFKAAEALRPSPLLSYNIGLSNEKLHKKRVAVKYYHRYLDAMPNAPNRAEVERSIAELERQIAAEPPPPPAGQPQTGVVGGTSPTAEQPSDMPPPATAAPAPQPGGYDPYASTAPNGSQPAVAQPPKKKSYWWVALIVAGGVTLIAIIAVVAWYELSLVNSTSTFNHALTNPRTPAADRTPSTYPLFRF